MGYGLHVVLWREPQLYINALMPPLLDGIVLGGCRVVVAVEHGVVYEVNDLLVVAHTIVVEYLRRMHRNRARLGLRTALVLSLHHYG